MSNSSWAATDWGVETPEGFGLPIERCAELRKSRYPVLKEVASRFYGFANDIGFIRAWREAMGRHGIPIEQDAFRLTIREISRMHSHRFVYAVAEGYIAPPRFEQEPDDVVRSYFERTYNPHHAQIEGETRAIFATSSLKGTGSIEQGRQAAESQPIVAG